MQTLISRLVASQLCLVLELHFAGAVSPAVRYLSAPLVPQEPARPAEHRRWGQCFGEGEAAQEVTDLPGGEWDEGGRTERALGGPLFCGAARRCTTARNACARRARVM